MKKVFVTGGSGFVGKTLIKEFLAKGHEVYALARSKSSAAKVKALGAIPRQGDLLDPVSLSSAVEGCELLVHSAAHMDFWGEKETFWKINVTGTEALLAAAKMAGVQRFIFISAAAVVGNGRPVYLKDERYVADPPAPDLYPMTKFEAEKRVLAANEPDFTTIALRPPAIWGPDNHHFEEVWEMARKGKFRWIGKGKQGLSFIHVQNLAAACLAAMQKGKGGQVYYVNDGERFALNDFLTRVGRANGVQLGNKNIPRGVAMGMSKAFQAIWKLFGIKKRPPVVPMVVRLMGTELTFTDAKARKELGYRNAISIEQGLKEIRAGREA